MRIGILTEFPSPAVQSGPAIHTKFLQESLERRGHSVVMMGPDHSDLAPVPTEESQLYPSFPYPTHPKVRVALPGSPRKLWETSPKVDLIHGQTNSHMVHYALWMREMWQIPVLTTQTIDLPLHSHFLLSDKLYANDTIREWWKGQAYAMERSFARQMYSRSDALIVQSRHLVDYWRERGVTSPIEVVGRPINPAVFSRQPTEDPFPAHFRVGKRLLTVSRHDREKNLHEMLQLFSEHIAPRDPEVTLTLVGDGHDHKNLVDEALASPYADRIHFPGEARHQSLVNWYAHADVFVYTSLSETFGNVINEALWSGLPVVAYDDRKGVAGQVVDGVNGFLVEPNRSPSHAEFANACLRLMGDRAARRKMGEEAANLARRTSHPDVILGRFERIYAEATERVRREIPVPLSEQSRLRQVRAFARAYAQWGFWNSTLLGLAYTATRLGASRTGGASQHEAVVAAAREAGRETAWTVPQPTTPARPAA